jgi:hypothetical protein
LLKPNYHGTAECREHSHSSRKSVPEAEEVEEAKEVEENGWR